MDEIYIIVTGVYSDWQVLGYVTSEEAAEKICARETEGNKDRETYWIQVANMDDISKTVDKIWYVHRLFAKSVDDGDGVLKLEIVYNDFERPITDYAHHLPCIEEGSKYIEIKVWTDKKDDKEKAKKIAQDVLYKYIAQKIGLG